jgi:glycosyltransferase involved in cell wall biosynthesis
MAAGLYTITTNYGALYETCAEFSTYIPYQKDYLNLAKQFAYAIDAVANKLNSESVQQHLQSQIDYVNQYYNWNKQGRAWTNFLQGAINARRK